jgi:hypothetical protein
MNSIEINLMQIELTYDLWQGVMMSYSCTPSYQQLLRRDFFEELNYGWYAEYIYPYDDLYVPIVSKERKLRIGGAI